MEKLSKNMIVILGAGITGLSSSYHIGHDKCTILEKKGTVGGHISHDKYDEFIFDHGPHVSFTKNVYVKNIFSESVNDQFIQHDIDVVNYWKGIWIDHPAQSNLFPLDKELKIKIFEEIVESRKINSSMQIHNYEDWLILALGETFYKEFSKKYTKKYWTIQPSKLTTLWVGERVFNPLIEDVAMGLFSKPNKKHHYITTARYPKRGGYVSFAEKFVMGARVEYRKEMKNISFRKKNIILNDNTVLRFDKLVSTIPLPELIFKSDAPQNIKEEAKLLSCSELLLINIGVNHQSKRTEKWLYVYDENKYSTRINFTELLSPNNAPTGKSGIQVEVYFSKYNKQTEDDEIITHKVINELLEMGLLENKNSALFIKAKHIKYANVIFDHFRENALNNIFKWLEEFGLVRESDDLEHATNWDKKFINTGKLGDIILAGRFGQWKYYWSDDCVLRGRYIGCNLL